MAAVALLAELAFILVNVSALPVYLEFGLGLPKLVGISLGSFYLAEALANSPMGALGDKWGRRRLMTVGALISVCTCIGTAFVRVPSGGGPPAWLGIGLIILLRVLDGVGAAALWPSMFASVSDRVPASRQTQAMSLLNISYFVGIALGPYVGGFVNNALSRGMPYNDPARYVPSFLTAAVCFLTAAVLAYFVAPRRGETAPHPPAAPLTDHEQEALGEAGPAASHDPHETTYSLIAVKRALKIVPALMVLGFLTFLAIGLIAPYVKLFAMKRYEIGEETFGKLLLYPALLVAVVSVPLGRLTDMWGKTLAIRVGMGVCAAALWMMLTIHNEWALVVLGSLLGIGFVLAFPAYMAYIADQASAGERGGLIGAVRMAQGFGAMLGTYLAAPLYQADEEHLILFGLASGLLTLAFLLSLFFVRERRGQPAAP